MKLTGWASVPHVESFSRGHTVIGVADAGFNASESLRTFATVVRYAASMAA